MLCSFVVLMVLAIRASIRNRGVSLPMPTAAASAPGGPSAAPGGRSAASAPASGAPTGAAASTGGSAERPRPGRDRSRAAEDRPVDRRSLTGALVGLGTVLGVTALGGALDRSGGGGAAAVGGGSGLAADGGGPVAPTGETTTIAVSMAQMRFDPDVLEVPAGNTLVIELRNDDEGDVHDLVLANGVDSGRMAPGASLTLTAGVISNDLEGWCSIVGHRSMGMTLQVRALGGGGGRSAQPSAAGVAELEPVALDLQAAPGAEHAVRDARLPAAVSGDQRLTLEMTEVAAEIAPGVLMDAMTYEGTVVGPILRSEPGARLTVDLVNHGSMGHSLDLHAGRVSPDEVMRTLAPGERLEYAITTEYAGIWLYHCATAPMTVHLAAGMVGALIVPPADLAPADREYVLVQSEHYLVPAGAPGYDAARHEGAHPVSPAKIAAERPDATVFNGHATQYVHAPLEARVGERVRLWVLAAGPSRGISFHVVGGIFDTVFKEGAYLLRPEDGTDGGAQALDLASAQGGFVELVFDEPGTYTAVNHSFVDMERGAKALIRVTG